MGRSKKEIKPMIIDLLNRYARKDETKQRDLKLKDHGAFITDNFEGLFRFIEEARVERGKAWAKYEQWKLLGIYDGEKRRELQSEIQLKDAIYHDYLERLYKYLIGEEQL